MGCLQPRLWRWIVPEPPTLGPEDRSALTTHAKWFNVRGNEEGEQGLEESPPRQRGTGWEVGAWFLAWHPPSLAVTGQVTSPSGLLCSLLSLGRAGVSAEVRLEGVGSRVRGLCPQGTHHH